MSKQPTITVTETGNLHIHIPMLIRRMRGRKVIIAPKALDGDVPDSPGTVQTAIVQALARAFSWAEVIESGEVKSISELATNLDVDNSYVARILKLTTLAPDIIEAILNGRAASSRKRNFDPQSARYDFRVFLLHLGLIGDEFKTARKHLLAALPGDSAFKRGRPKPETQTAVEADVPTEAGPQTRPPAFSGDEPAVTNDGGTS